MLTLCVTAGLFDCLHLSAVTLPPVVEQTFVTYELCVDEFDGLDG